MFGSNGYSGYVPLRFEVDDTPRLYSHRDDPHEQVSEGNLWFSSSSDPNPNIFKGVVENGNGPLRIASLPDYSNPPLAEVDYRNLLALPPYPGARSLPPYPSTPNAKEEQIEYPSISSAKEAQVEAAEDNADDKGKEGEEEEDDIVDSVTNLLYDELLTHFLDAVAKATREILRSYYINSGLSVLVTSMTIVLNALIMVAKHLNIPSQVITIFAALNMISKGLEMKFKFSHQAQDLQSRLEEAKLTAAEAEDLLIKCKHSNLEKSEIMEFKIYYAKAFRGFADHVPARDLDHLIDPSDGGNMAGKCKAEDEAVEETDADCQDLFMDQLKHYKRQLEAATKSLLYAFSMSKVASSILTMITLCVNPMIISAGEMHLDPTFVAYLGGINTVVKGFELRFKFENQTSHLEHVLEKAHVLRNECDELMIVGEAKLLSDVEVSSFKRELDDAMEGMVMYMLDGDEDLLRLQSNADKKRSARDSSSQGTDSARSWQRQELPLE